MRPYHISNMTIGKGVRYTTAVVLNLIFIINAAMARDGIEKAKNFFDARKYSEAKTAFELILETDSESAEAHYFLGRLYFHNGDYNKAKDYLEKATEIDKANIDYHLWLCTIYRDKARTSNFVSALKWAIKWKGELETAFKINPTHLETRKRLIGYLLNAPGIVGGEMERGKKLAEETIAIDEIQGRLLLAQAYQHMGQVDSALLEYEKVLALDPQNSNVHRDQGYMFLYQKNYLEAESNFRNYIKISPDDANAYNSLGDYFLERDMRDQAIGEYQKAIEIDPEFSDSRFKLARAYDKKGMLEEAFYHYEKWVELTPGSVSYTHLRAHET